MAKNIQRTIVLTVSGKEVENSFNGMSKTVRGLERELKKLTPGTDEFMKKSTELKEARGHFEKVKNEIDQVNGKLKDSEGFLGKLSSGLADIGLSFGKIGLGLAAFQISQKAEELLKISDAMADVQKTTGMAIEEVKGLWDAFDEMNTRTSKMDRLKIAEVGGRLGVAKEEMASFVQEVDKAYVALGDSFQGGLETVVDSLGKIKGLFDETKGKSYADAINEVGSALNELAASGTASEGNISDFALRVGALPDALKPSVDKVLGLGAAFEESGIDAQIAASGYSNFMKVAGENLQKFATSMNMSYAEAQKLFNEKPEEFFLRFAEGMRGIPAEQTALIFASLKIGTLEVQKAVGAATNRTDDFRKAMNRAGEAMAEATSLNDEFNKKNNNAAAVWEKLKNAISDIFTKTNVINLFEGLINALGWLTGITNEAGDGIKIFKERLVLLSKIIAVILVSFFSYNLAIKLHTMWLARATAANVIHNAVLKANEMRLIALKAVKYAVIALYSLLTLNINRATAAMRMLGIVTKMNPWGLLLSVITAVISAIVLFNEETKNSIKLLKEQEAQLKVNADIQRKIAKEEAASLSDLRKKTEFYISVIKNKNSSLEARKLAYEKLIAISPTFKGTLDSEYRATNRLTEANNQLINKLKEAARVRAYKKLLDEYEDERVNAEQTKIDAEFAAQEEENENQNRRKRNVQRQKEEKKVQAIAGKFADKNDRAAMAMLSAATYEYDKKEKANELNNAIIKLKNAETKVNNLTQRISNDKNLSKKILAGNDNTSSGVIGNNGIVSSSKKDKNHQAKDLEKKKAEEEKKDLEDSKKRKEKAERELISLTQELEEEKLKIKQSSQETEFAEAELARQKELNAQKQHSEDILKNIAELEEKIKNAKTADAKANYKAALTKEREALFENDKLIAQAEGTHLKKINAIKEKYRLQDYQKSIQQSQIHLEKQWQAKETEIQNITSLEDAKKELENMKFLKLTETEMRNIRTLEDAKKALRENAARELLATEIKVIEEQKKKIEELLKDPSLSPEALNQLRKDLVEVDSVMTRLKGTLQGKKEEDDAKKITEQTERKKSVDLLGFSVSEWEEMWENLGSTEGKIKGVQMAVQALSNAFQRFSQLQQALNEKEMRKFSENQDKKKKALLVQLNQGLISQEEYQKGIQNLDEETADKKRQIQRRAAKAEKAANIANAIAGTAAAVVGALGNKPWTPANFILAGLVGAMGAVQVATIASQPIPEFAEGGFTGVGNGKPDRTGFRPVGIVHENEYVTPKWMLENPVVADVVDWMESIRTGRTQIPKGYADGGLASDDSINQKPRTNNTEPMIINEIQPVLSDLKDLLQNLKINGVEAWMVEDAENGKRLKRTIKMFEKIETKNARK